MVYNGPGSHACKRFAFELRHAECLANHSIKSKGEHHKESKPCCVQGWRAGRELSSLSGPLLHLVSSIALHALRGYWIKAHPEVSYIYKSGVPVGSQGHPPSPSGPQLMLRKVLHQSLQTLAHVFDLSWHLSHHQTSVWDQLSPRLNKAQGLRAHTSNSFVST